ncbi:MAG: alpha-ketoacid dehydrogenase subunit beta [Bacillota bacterium]|nr:alpha-ketoacid dehydrogenase subunit beta [Bacillota bacterium]
MAKITCAQAIREALRQEMERDDRVFILGEDVGQFGGCFGVTGNLVEIYGEERVRDTPISETAIVGAAVGAAAVGMRPVAELMFNDFATVAMDQIVNQAAKMRYMFGGKATVPMTVRLPYGGGISAAAQHSQSLEAWLTHIPGLKVVMPATPEDYAGLLLTSIRDENPVMFFESKMHYGLEGEVPDVIEPIPMGKARIHREGTDVTIVATGAMVQQALAAAETLAGEGISVEVLDPRTLVPLDKEAIKASVAKTNKVVIVNEAVKRGSFSGEIAAMIADECFDDLDAPVKRIGALNVPIPFSPTLEQFVIPNAERIVKVIKEMM